MKHYIFVGYNEGGAYCSSKEFKNVYDAIYLYVQSNSELCSIVMYSIPTTAITGRIVNDMFNLYYKDQVIDQEDFDVLNIKSGCILEGQCCDDIRGAADIATYCDLSFKKD